jgi:hypothetical protein
MINRTRKMVAILAIVFIAFLFTLTGCSNITHLPTQPILTDSTNSASCSSANGLSLTLSLNSTAYKLYQDVSLVIVENNTLSKTNRVSREDKWRLSGLTLGPCGWGSPFGVAVFQGYYTSSNVSTVTPLVIFDPNAIYHCPCYSWAEGAIYEFRPLSDIAAISYECDPPCNDSYDTQIYRELQLSHYWTGSRPAIINSFDPGVYTVVAGDEWGALVVLHFTVMQ